MRGATSDLHRRVQAESYVRREFSRHPSLDEGGLKRARPPGPVCVDVVGKVRSDKEVTPIGFRESDRVPQTRERAITQANRGKAKALETLGRGIADQGEILRALSSKQCLCLVDLARGEEGSNMLLRESAEVDHVWLTITRSAAARKRRPLQRAVRRRR